MKSSPRHDPGSAELTIGELAGHFGLATHVLRHWEAAGLLQPDRRVNGRRRYGRDQLTRVAIIVHARRVGIGLDRLRVMLTTEDATARRTVLRHHRDELDQQIVRATASRDLLDHALACPAEDFLYCPDFQQMVHRLDADCARRPGEERNPPGR
ncbi:MerR family transcriptional regulator [Plantactinospora sonchi]|uniref:MerR family transcriptional regulator n=1 Tax=Plantactinospora sonchi TaxID=1544735 RepID=A0ABU7RU42_9ACTN